MKKLLIFLLIAVLAFCFAACKLTDDATDDKTVHASEPAGTANSESDPPVIVITPRPTGSSVIEERVIIDESTLKVTLKDLDTESSSAPALKLYIENFSDTDLVFNTDFVAVNGYMNSGYMSKTIEAGKKTYGSIQLSGDDIKNSGFGLITNIEFAVRVYRQNDYEPYFVSDTIAVKISDAEGNESAFDPSGNTVYDKDGFKIVAQELANDPVNGPKITFYIENNSDKDMTLSSTGVSINDIAIDDLLYVRVIAGKRAIVKAPLLSEWTEIGELGTIETITMSFVLRNVNDYTDVVVTEPVTLDLG